MTVSWKDAYAAIDSIFVNHPNFAYAMEEIRDLIELAPARTAPCIHVSGPPGVGKSTLKDRIAVEYPPVPNGAQVKLMGGLKMTADRHQLLIATMPPSPTVKGLARELLKAYGDEFWNRGDEYTLGDRVDRFVAANQTAAILIDEAQRAVERSGTVVSDKLIDWIKSRHETNSVGIILLGLGNLRHLFDADRQIERRWDAEIRLEPYRWFQPNGDPDYAGQDNFIGLLATFRDLSPVPLEFDVEDDDIAFRFFYLSRGLVDGIKKVLLKSTRLMKRGDKVAIDLPLLREAAEGAFRLEKNGMQNPFCPTFIAQPPPPLDDDYEIKIAKKRIKGGSPTSGSKRRRAQAVNKHLIL
ncbi:MAG: TniB family NTP-binding protein [Brevundimonas sp.]|uniref:TniB family NTP-binding protein n=1 Tax=Brevundimonas sp. TaxID=1871086 RepID=UPI00391AE688